MVALQTSRSATINVFMADGFYDLQLTLEQLINLQEKLDLGPAALLEKLRTGTWRVEHIIEPIRFGLIGAGMGHQAAYTFVTRYVQVAYLLEYLPVALQVIYAALSGVEDDIIEGETEAVTATTPETTDNL